MSEATTLPVVMPVPELRPGMPLSQILDLMNAVDEGRAELTFDQMRELANMCERKVDARKWVLSYLESREERLSKQIEILRGARELARKRIDDIKADMIDDMREKGFKKLVGETFKVSIRRSAAVEVELPANGDTFGHFGQFMRVKYEWDKPLLKKALVENPMDLVGVARIVENESAVFTVRGAKEDEGDHE